MGGVRKEGILQVDDVGGGAGVDVNIVSPIPLPTSEHVLALRFDAASNPLLYLGEAEPGSLNANPVWRIMRFDVSSGVEGEWADGNSLFDKIWNDRATYSYS